MTSVLSALEKRLPKSWSVSHHASGFFFTLLSDGLSRVTQRTVFVGHSGDVNVSVHGKELEKNHPVYKNVSNVQLLPSSVSLFVENALKLVSDVRLYEVCVGAESQKFKQWWKNSLDTCVIDVNPFQEIRYSETLRSKSCSYLISQRSRHCEECGKVLHRFANRNLVSPSTTKTPKKNKPLKHCNSAEKAARAKRAGKTIRNLKRQVERLKAKLSALIESDGVNVDEDLSNDFSKVLEEERKKTEADLKDGKLTAEEMQQKTFFDIFMQEQLKASQVKGANGMRWHPLLIRFALQLKMCSTQAYNCARTFMKLPCERTLYDYFHIYDVDEGVKFDFINEVSQQVKNLKNYSYQRFHILMCDEIVISEKIVQKKSTGEVIGYCKLNEVQTEMMELQRKLESEAQELKNQPITEPQITKKMLSFMIKGTANSVLSTVAFFSVHNLTREDLYQHTMEVIFCLESAGIGVVCLVCDGSNVNRGFLQMLPPIHKTDSGVVYDTPNPFAPERPIFLISDPSHLIKTTRNGLESSGKKKKRLLTKNGEEMTWDTIIRLFQLKADQTIKQLHKLKPECVYLNGFSRMRVNFACRVISQSVASVLKTVDWPNTKELSVFVNF